MIDLIIGIVIGAVFSPFWLKIYNWGKDRVSEMLDRRGE